MDQSKSVPLNYIFEMHARVVLGMGKVVLFREVSLVQGVSL